MRKVNTFAEALETARMKSDCPYTEDDIKAAWCLSVVLHATEDCGMRPERCEAIYNEVVRCWNKTDDTFSADVIAKLLAVIKL